jgi:predicted secreted protein
MAETKVSGRDYILLADIDNDGTYKPVACLTSNSITSTLGTIDATSKCGDSYTPSPSFNQSIECEGFAIDETGTPAKDSYQQLYAAHAAKTQFAMKMGKATPSAGDITYSGTVFISNFGVNAADKDDVKFTATFVVTTPPLTQTETA